ncbi:MAG: hypothetical protein ACXVZ2_07075 [Gaiellaceae bacterium]
MELEITPEPTPEERRAIELALEAGDEGRSAWAASLDGGAAAQQPGREPGVVEP